MNMQMARGLALIALVTLSGCGQGSEKDKLPVDTTIVAKAPESPKTNLNSQPTPVSMDDVKKGSDKFWVTYREGGMDGAQIESERCFENLKTNPDWPGLDNCMSYDLSASFVDGGMAKVNGFELREYFQPDEAFKRWEEISTIITGEKYSIKFLGDRIEIIMSEATKNIESKL